MGSKKMTPEERAARAARREARADRSVQRRVNEVAGRELFSRVTHAEAMIEAKGFASKRATVIGTPSGRPNNPVTPTNENEDRDDSATPTD